ncbi:MAG: hypothetical protein L0Y58_09000 [Verrucomicrobia subdivision 3 bacterium]|nr:hypothetical protein [Limisphaerales bacterium]
MKDTVGILLVGALCLSAILTIWYAIAHFFAVKDLQHLYARQLVMDNARAAAQALAGEAVEYSQRNPAIDPILYQFQIKFRAATNQPAAKP